MQEVRIRSTEAPIETTLHKPIQEPAKVSKLVVAPLKKTASLFEAVDFAMQNPDQMTDDVKSLIKEKLRQSEEEKGELKSKLFEQGIELKDLKTELDQLKRRIERQESDYIQTMRLNTMLKSQVQQLQQDGPVPTPDPNHAKSVED